MDGGEQLGGDDFVAVYVEYPVVSGEGGSAVLHVAKAVKGVVVKGYVGVSSGDGEGVVGGAVVQQ